MFDTLRNENNINKFFLSIASVIFVMILLMSCNAFYNGGDDYDFMFCLKNTSIFENCYNGYFNWDGRFLTLGAFVQAFCLKYIQIEFIVLFWTLCFLISGILIFYIIDLEFNLYKLDKTAKRLFLLLIPILFCFGSFLHIAETVFWATGGVYSFHLLIGATWTFLFLKMQQSNPTIILKTVFILYSLIAGATTQNLSIALISLVLLTMIIDFLNKKKIKNLFNALFLVALIAGIIFISVAPGNQNRIKLSNQMVPGYFIGLFYLKNFVIILFKYLIASGIIIIFSALSGFLLTFYLNKNIKIKFKAVFFKLKTKQDLIDALILTKWFWVAASCATAFLTIPEFVSRRSSIYFMYFLMIFVLISTLRIFQFFSVETTENKHIKQNLNLKNKILSLLLIGFLIMISYDFYKSYQLKLLITARESVFKSNKNKTIYIKLINPKLDSYFYKYNDIVFRKGNSSTVSKESQERFYKVKIKTIK